MKNAKWSTIAFVLGILNCTVVMGQLEKGKIKENAKITAEFKKDEQHRYTINLKKNQFALLKITQLGVDVAITTFDLKGGKMDEFDSPNGTNGPEYVSIVSEVAGNYSFLLKPFESANYKGVYTIELLKLEPMKTDTEGQVDQLFIPWTTLDTPGAAIAIVKDGKVVYKKGYGAANLEYEIPTIPSTVFHVASVSKQFTAFSILLLEKEGKLSLDEDVRKYLPEVPDFGKKITLRQLVYHTSGLRDQWSLLAMAGWRLDDVITQEQILKLISKQKELNFEPGTEYLYCNTGYTLLAEVVERVSGKSFTAFTEEKIFKPLKMTHTLFCDDHEKIVKNKAYSYYLDSTYYKKSVLNFSTVGATSLLTSAEDLSLWANNFENPIVGDNDCMKEMNRRGTLTNGDTLNYAFGQLVYRYKGVLSIGHGGVDAGYRAYLGRFPEQKFSVVVLSNDAGFDAGTIAMKIADIYLKNNLQKDKKEEAKQTGEEMSIEAALLQEYLGDFELLPGFILSITLEDGKLYGQSTGQPRFKLKPISTTEFKGEIKEATISFHPDSTNRVSNLSFYQGGKTMNAIRVKPTEIKIISLNDYIGSYYSEEIETTFEFVLEKGMLVAKNFRHSNIQLTPTKKDVLAGSQWFFNKVDMVRDGSNTIIGMKVSNGRARNVWFKKVE